MKRQVAFAGVLLLLLILTMAVNDNGLVHVKTGDGEFGYKTFTFRLLDGEYEFMEAQLGQFSRIATYVSASVNLLALIFIWYNDEKNSYVTLAIALGVTIITTASVLAYGIDIYDDDSWSVSIFNVTSSSTATYRAQFYLACITVGVSIVLAMAEIYYQCQQGRKSEMLL